MNDKPVFRYLRLKDNHPVMEKLMKLSDYAEELGISISFSHHGTIVEDTDWHGPRLVMSEIIDNGYENGVMEWPPATEFKIVYENPVWTAEEARKEEEYRRQQEKLEAERQRNLIESNKRAEAQRMEQLELRERVQLAALKTKYPDK